MPSGLQFGTGKLPLLNSEERSCSFACDMLSVSIVMVGERLASWFLFVGGSRRHLATSGINDPKMSVDKITSKRTEVTMTSYSVKIA